MRAKVARSRRKPSSKKAWETGLQAEAQSLAMRAATCREAWDAAGAVKVIQEAAERMESLEIPRKLLKEAARDAIQVLDLDHPKTQRLVSDPLRRLGVKQE